MFANWGYVTAWHNFHGSSGFGQAWTDSITKEWAELPYQDTIKAAEWFAAQPWIDADRMAAGGGSYGGYLASLLLGKPHPFKTLVAHAAVYDLVHAVRRPTTARPRSATASTGRTSSGSTATRRT